MNDLPQDALVVRKYDEFRQLVEAFAHGSYQLLTIIGDPGIGKSEIVRRAMLKKWGAENWGYVRGAQSELCLYKSLYEYRRVPLVFDDLHGLFEKPRNKSHFKCVCEMTPIKRLHWESTHHAFNDEGLPTSFDSISSVCVIANNAAILSRDKDLQAIQNRGVLVIFEPNPVEVHRELAGGGWFDDEEVFRFIGENLFLVTRPSFRMYLNAREHKRAGLDWQDLTLRTIDSDNEPNILIVARILADQNLAGHARIEEYQRRAINGKGCSRATFFRIKAKLDKWRGEFDGGHVSKIKLEPVRHDPLLAEMQEQRQLIEQVRDQEWRAREMETMVTDPPVAIEGGTSTDEMIPVVSQFQSSSRVISSDAPPNAEDFDYNFCGDLSNLDIEELLERNDVYFRSHGNNEWGVACPLHKGDPFELDARFKFSDDGPVFRCPICTERGIQDFLAYFGMEAVKQCCSREDELP